MPLDDCTRIGLSSSSSSFSFTTISTSFSSSFLFLLRGLLVEQLVQVVEARLGSTVNVVPPVADEVLLVENCAVGAEEGCFITARGAHVERLTLSSRVCVEAREGLISTVKTSVRHSVVDRIVNTGLSGNGVHLTSRAKHCLEGEFNSKGSEVRQA